MHYNKDKKFIVDLLIGLLDSKTWRLEKYKTDPEMQGYLHAEKRIPELKNEITDLTNALIFMSKIDPENDL